jgi:hypothetical protein
LTPQTVHIFDRMRVTGGGFSRSASSASMRFSSLEILSSAQLYALLICHLDLPVSPLQHRHPAPMQDERGNHHNR